MVRFKLRYYLVDIQTLTKKPHTASEIYSAIKQAVFLNFGDYGLSKIMFNFRVKYYNSETNLAIVRCERDSGDML